MEKEETVSACVLGQGLVGYSNTASQREGLPVLLQIHA